MTDVEIVLTREGLKQRPVAPDLDDQFLAAYKSLVKLEERCGLLAPQAAGQQTESVPAAAPSVKRKAAVQSQDAETVAPSTAAAVKPIAASVQPTDEIVFSSDIALPPPKLADEARYQLLQDRFQGAFIFHKWIGSGMTSEVALVQQHRDLPEAALKAARVDGPMKEVLLAKKRLLAEGVVLANVPEGKRPLFPAIHQILNEPFGILVEHGPGSHEQDVKDVREKQISFEPDKLCRFVRASTDSMQVLLDMDILHLDPKPTAWRKRKDGSYMLVDISGARGADTYVQSSQSINISTSLTVKDVGVFTKGYEAPEVGRGKPAGVESLIFSLAANYYEIVTGEIPLHRCFQPPEGTYKFLAPFFARALHFDPTKRYHSLPEMQQAFFGFMRDAGLLREDDQGKEALLPPLPQIPVGEGITSNAVAAKPPAVTKNPSRAQIEFDEMSRRVLGFLNEGQKRSLLRYGRGAKMRGNYQDLAELVSQLTDRMRRNAFTIRYKEDGKAASYELTSKVSRFVVTERVHGSSKLLSLEEFDADVVTASYRGKIEIPAGRQISLLLDSIRESQKALMARSLAELHIELCSISGKADVLPFLANSQRLFSGFELSRDGRVTLSCDHPLGAPEARLLRDVIREMRLPFHITDSAGVMSLELEPAAKERLLQSWNDKEQRGFPHLELPADDKLQILTALHAEDPSFSNTIDEDYLDQTAQDAGFRGWVDYWNTQGRQLASHMKILSAVGEHGIGQMIMDAVRTQPNPEVALEEFSERGLSGDDLGETDFSQVGPVVLKMMEEGNLSSDAFSLAVDMLVRSNLKNNVLADLTRADLAKLRPSSLESLIKRSGEDGLSAAEQQLLLSCLQDQGTDDCEFHFIVHAALVDFCERRPQLLDEFCRNAEAEYQLVTLSKIAKSQGRKIEGLRTRFVSLAADPSSSSVLRELRDCPSVKDASEVLQVIMQRSEDSMTKADVLRQAGDEGRIDFVPLGVEIAVNSSSVLRLPAIRMLGFLGRQSPEARDCLKGLISDQAEIAPAALAALVESRPPQNESKALIAFLKKRRLPMFSLNIPKNEIQAAISTLSQAAID